MLKTCYCVCLLVLSILTDIVRCEPDYVFNFQAKTWLKLYSTPAVWEEAFLRCHNDGAVLASPLNKELADALCTQMAQFAVNGHIFLGTHDLFAKGLFTSVEGVPLSDMDITLGSDGKGPDTGDCLTMSVDGSAYYSSCNESLPYICYSPMINECGTFGYKLNQQTGSCYKIHTTRKTWTRAYSVCASEGSHLVILNDEEEARIVKDMFPAPKKKANKLDGFHVGLIAWGKERIWTTIHGESIETVYNKWQPGEPNNWAGSEDRGLSLWNGHLDDGEKDTRPLMFACEKSPISKQFEDSPPNTENMMRLCSICDEYRYLDLVQKKRIRRETFRANSLM